MGYWERRLTEQFRGASDAQYWFLMLVGVCDDDSCRLNRKVKPDHGTRAHWSCCSSWLARFYSGCSGPFCLGWLLWCVQDIACIGALRVGTSRPDRAHQSLDARK